MADIQLHKNLFLFFEKIKKISIYLILFTYPFGIYTFDLFKKDLGIYSLLSVVLVLILSFLFFFEKVSDDKNYNLYKIQVFALLIIGTLISFLSFEKDLYYGNFTGSLFLTSIFLFYFCIKIFFNRLNLSNLISYLIYITIAIAIYIILQFILYKFFGYTLNAAFCTYDICRDNFETLSHWGYMNLARPSAFFTSANRPGSYLIAGYLLTFLFKKNYRLTIFRIIIATAIILNLSRNSIFIFLFSNLFLIFVYKPNFINKIKEINLKIYLIFFSVLFYIYEKIFLIILPFDFQNKFSIINMLFASHEELSSFGLLFNYFSASILASISNMGLGVGFDIVDDYLFQNYELGIWGSHSNVVQLTGGLGLIFSSFLFCCIFNILKKLLLICKKNKLALILFLINLSFIFSGIIRTFFLSYYAIFFLSLSSQIIKKGKKFHDYKF